MGKNNKFDFKKCTFCVITGASRGIGQTIAIECAKRFIDNSTLLLIARSQTQLNETKMKIETINKNLNVIIQSIDLTEPSHNDLKQVFDQTLNINSIKYENALIIHNAGTLGDVSKKAIQLNDLENWKKYYSLNFFTVTLLNSIFVEKLKPITPNMYIVNITSLCGRQPFPSLAQYGSGKAARDLFFRVLAKEEQDIIVLNYSPGPVDTDMVKTIVERTVDVEIKKTFEEMFQKQTILTPSMTVNKFLSVLEAGEYESGAIVDYFD